jgi:hypothetical protein
MSRANAASDIFSGLGDTDGEKSKLFGLGGLSNLDVTPRASSALDMYVIVPLFVFSSHIKLRRAGTRPAACGGWILDPTTACLKAAAVPSLGELIALAGIRISASWFL